MIYEFAEGSRLQGNAQKVGEELEKLRNKGTLNATTVVERASLKNSPLRPFIFKESDRRAAYERRLELARHLIRCVVRKPETEDEPEVRAFVKVGNEDEYQGIEVVLSDTEMRQQLLAEISSQARMMARKLTAYEDLSELLQAVRTVHKVAVKATKGKKKPTRQGRARGARAR